MYFTPTQIQHATICMTRVTPVISKLVHEHQHIRYRVKQAHPFHFHLVKDKKTEKLDFIFYIYLFSREF
jgi:hypothetical protein